MYFCFTTITYCFYFQNIWIHRPMWRIVTTYGKTNFGIRSNPEYHYSSPDSGDSGGGCSPGGSSGSLSMFNNNTNTTSVSGGQGGYYSRQHRRSSPSRLSSECRSASDLSSMLLQHQYNQQLLRIRRLNSYYAGRTHISKFPSSCST